MSDLSWFDSGVEQVDEGVYRIPLPLPHDSLRAINVYAIESDDELVLIDSGWDLPESLAALEAGLASIGHGLGDIERFLVTHQHPDHYSQALAIRQAWGTPVYLGASEKPSLDRFCNPQFSSLDETLIQLGRAGADELIAPLRSLRDSARDIRAALQWEYPDGWIEQESLGIGLRSIEAIATPGHTRGHMVFHDPAAGLLFSGDHILPTITPSVGLEPVPSALPLADFMKSLRLILERPDARLLPAHGAVTDSAHARCVEILAHHERRLGEMAAAVADGCHTPYQVARALRWTKREKALGELDLANQNFAVHETWVHLDLCVDRGVLSRTRNPAGVDWYASV